MRSELTTTRESVFLQALERGMNTTQIAEIARVSVQYVRRLVARARSAPLVDEAFLKQLTDADLADEDPPRLELVSEPTLSCTHPRAGLHLGSHVRYCLDCDAISVDGFTWIPAQSPATPSVAVLAPRKSGRGARLQRLTAGSQAEPGGPTSHQADPRGLRGGRS